jgi:hypothetical protein
VNKVCIGCGRPEDQCDYREKPAYIAGELVGINKSCRGRDDRNEKWTRDYLREMNESAAVRAAKHKSWNSITEIIPMRHRINLNGGEEMSRISSTIQYVVSHWDTYISTNLLSVGCSAIGKSFDYAWALTELDRQGKWRVSDDFAWTTVKGMCSDIINGDRDVEFYGECRILVIEDLQQCVGNEAHILQEVADYRANGVNYPIWMTATITPDELEDKFESVSLINRLFQVDDLDKVPRYQLINKMKDSYYLNRLKARAG